MVGGKTLKRRDQIHLKKNRQDLVAFIPFAVIIALPGTFILMPLIFKFLPFLIPSVFRTSAMAEMIDGKPERKVEILTAVPKELQAVLEKALGALPPAHRAALTGLEADFAEVIRQSTHGGTSYEALLKVKDLGVLLPLNSFPAEQLKGYSYLLGLPSFFPHRNMRSHLDFVLQDDRVGVVSFLFSFLLLPGLNV